ncbi:MAG: hypothetical protein KDA80_10970 [Planctomycetaceae bacterium]|nr:hypothetical protein [Planctomycetaceae bacterium]
MRSWPHDDRRTQEFVGSQQCRECHEEIFRRYQSHPMSRSVRTVTELSDSRVARNAEFQQGPCQYEVDWRPDAMIHTEIGETFDGAPLYQQDFEVEFAVGSGQRGYSFLSYQSGGLFQSALTWYAEQETWDLSPGYRPESHPRFERRVSDGCVACHFGRMSPVDSAPHRFHEDVVEEAAIGCERCHGPGGTHVRFQSGESDLVDSIVNPSDLPPAHRESVCYQCHLHGVDRILREGRSEYDFRPGDLLSDIWTVFVSEESVDASGTSAVSQVEQITGSQCFQQSQGAFGCISCHDPHGIPREDERVAYYRNRCLTCHGEERTPCGLPAEQRTTQNPMDSCIDCHMPKLSANDVPHTSQTDHRILKQPQQPAFDANSKSGQSLSVFQRDQFPVSAESGRRATGLLFANQASATNSPRTAAESAELLAEFLASPSEDVPVLKAQSFNLYLLRNPQSQRLAELANEREPMNEAVLETLSLICQHTGQISKGIEYTQELLRLNPWNSPVWERLAVLQQNLGNEDAALESAIRSTEINPRRISAHRLAESLAKKLNRESIAERHRRFVDALSNGPTRAGDSGP